MPHDHDTSTALDMDAVNRAVQRQDFTALNKLIIESNTVGNDIVCLLAMVSMIHSQLKGLREDVAGLRRSIPMKGTN